MAGGIFVTQNKVRPGFYHKFTAKPKERNFFGETGVLALPLELDWGNEKEFIVIESDADSHEFEAKLGKTKANILPVREALKRGRKMMVWRVNAGGQKAKLDMTPQPVVATARCAGIRGNDITVQIDEDIDEPGKYTVTTYVDSMQQARQDGISGTEDIHNNDWVTFSGNGSITAAAGGQLLGGANGNATINDYNLFLEALEQEEFNCFGLPKDDGQLKIMFAAACLRMNDELGLMVQCVLPNYSEANYEAVISVKNGVELLDGEVIDKAQAVCWMTGAAASAYPAKALTYNDYENAVAADTIMTDAEIKAAIREGSIVFVKQKDVNGNDIAVVEQDVSTHTRFTQERPQEWSKNRIVRELYYIVRAFSRTFHLFYIGKVDNNAIGRRLFQSDGVTIMRQMQEWGAIENFVPEEDIRVEKGNTSDAVVVHLGVKPVDAMEKMYMTIELQ